MSGIEEKNLTFTYKPDGTMLRTGIKKQFWNTGELSWEFIYKKGLVSSTSYYKNGNLATEISYKDGKAVKGVRYTLEGIKNPMTNAHYQNLNVLY